MADVAPPHDRKDPKPQRLVFVSCVAVSDGVGSLDKTPDLD